MKTLELLHAMEEADFREPAFVDALRKRVVDEQAEFEDQARRMTMRNEDLEAAYGL